MIFWLFELSQWRHTLRNFSKTQNRRQVTLEEYAPLLDGENILQIFQEIQNDEESMIEEECMIQGTNF